MRLTAFVFVALVLMTAPAFSQQVYIDYDEDYDASHVETFAWAATPETSLAEVNPLMHSRLVNGLEYYITMNGAREVESDPDVYITYHTSTREDVVFNTTSMGYGYPGRWRGGGYYGGGGVSTTTASTYLRGTLVVDVWDARTKNLIWRGTASNITVSPKPEKMQKRLDKTLKKMFDKWQKIKDDKAKGK